MSIVFSFKKNISVFITKRKSIFLHRNKNMKNLLITSNGSFSCEEIISSLHGEADCLVGTNIYPQYLVGVSHLFDYTYLIPKPDNHNYISTLLSICKKHDIRYIFPLIDTEADILSKNRNVFSNQGITVCLSNHKSITLCRNKYALYKIFLHDSVITPIPTYSYADIKKNQCEELLKTSDIIAKPFNGRSSNGLIHLSDLSEIDYIPNKERYVFQPKIKGNFFTADYVRDSFGHDFSIVRKEILRTQHGAGLSVKIKQNETVQNMISHLGKKLQILGAINAEFIFDGKQYYLMDVNPRFSAGIAFSRLAGYDIVKNHFLCFQNKEIEYETKIKTCYAVKRYLSYITRNNHD